MRRVVITGLGTVSPIGNSVDAFAIDIKNGNSGISPIEGFDASETNVSVAGEVKDFDAREQLGKKDIQRMDKFSQFGVAASKEALNDSGYDISSESIERVGVIVSSGIGELFAIQDGIDRDER